MRVFTLLLITIAACESKPSVATTTQPAPPAQVAPSTPAPPAPPMTQPAPPTTQPAAPTPRRQPSPPSAPASTDPSCGTDTTDWCPAPPGDPCGTHKDTASCKADPKCGGIAFRGRTNTACHLDARGFANNCPTVGCRSLGK